MSLTLCHDCVVLAKASSPYCTEYVCGSFARTPCPDKELGHFPRTLLQNPGLIEELLDVLSRPYIKLRIDERDKAILFSILDNVEKVVSPVKGLRVCRDHEDDFLLETCLAAGHSCLLVTSDKDLLELTPNPFHKIRIIPPEEFLNMLDIE